MMRKHSPFRDHWLDPTERDGEPGYTARRKRDARNWRAVGVSCLFLAALAALIALGGLIAPHFHR